MGENDEVVRVQSLVKEIEALERGHFFEECQAYAPGRCPTCLHIYCVEHDEIERGVLRVEEDLALALEAGHSLSALLEGVRRLASIDVARCHARGKWPLSLAEVQDEDMIERMLSRRLDVRRLPQGQQSVFRPVLVSLTRCYQEQYLEACKARWPLHLFKHYNSPLQAGGLSLDWITGVSHEE